MAGASVGEAYVELHYSMDKLRLELATVRREVSSHVDGLKKDIDAKSKDMFEGINDQFERLNDGINTFRNLAVVSFAVAAAGAVLDFGKAMVAASQEITMLGNRLNDTLAVANGFDIASESANKLGVSVNAAAEGLISFSRSGKELGITNDQAKELNETIIMLGRVGNVSGQQLEQAMFQFYQGMQSGTLQGDELRSVLESFPDLARLIADELNVSVGELKDMGAEGEITSQVLVDALTNGGEEIRRKFAELPETAAMFQARWENAVTELMASLDQKLGASTFFNWFNEMRTGAAQNLTVALGGGSSSTQATVAEREFAAEQARLEEMQADAANPLNPLNWVADLPFNPVGLDAQVAKVEELKTKVGELKLEAMAVPEMLNVTNEDILGPGPESIIAKVPGEDREKAALDFIKGKRDELGLNEAEKLYEQTRTAAEKYAATVEKLGFQLAKGSIDQDTYNRAVAAAKKEVDDAEKKPAKTARKASGGLSEDQREAKRIFEETRTAAEAYAITVADLDAKLAKGLISQETYTRAVADAKEKMEAQQSRSAKPTRVSEEERERQQLMREGERIFEQTRTSAETYAMAVADLNAKLAAGAIDQDTYNRAVGDAEAKMRDAEEAAREKEQRDQERSEREIARVNAEARAREDAVLRDQQERWEAEKQQMEQMKWESPRQYYEQTGDSELAPIYDMRAGAKAEFDAMAEESMEFGRMMGDGIAAGADIAKSALYDLAKDGKMSIEDLTEALQDTALKAGINMLVNALVGGMGSAMMGGTGGGFAGPAQVTATSGGSMTGMSTSSYTMARGGIIDDAGIVRMARGGVVRAPTMLARGSAIAGEAGAEGVLPLKRGRNGDLGVQASGLGGGGGGGMSVSINDMRGAGAPAIEQRRRNEGGSEHLEIFIREGVNRTLSQGAADPVLKERFGQRPTPMR